MKSTGTDRPTSGDAGASHPLRGADDHALIDACLAGDQRAWATLVARYERLVFSVARRAGLSTESCEDVFQEVFTIAARQLSGIRNRSGLPKWFITTTRRVAHQAIRRAERGDPTETPAEQPSPESELMQLERAHLVHEGLDQLGGRCQQLLTALYLGGNSVSYEDLAQRLGMPLGSIGPTRARCLQKLMSILQALDRGRVFGDAPA